MPESSVRNIVKLPTLSRVVQPKMARELLLRLFRNITVGTLTLRDGDEVFTLGNDHRPEAPHADVDVHDDRTYWRILTGGTIASGEAYIAGEWSSRNLTEVTRLFSANMETMMAMKDKQSWIMQLGLKLAHFGRRNTEAGSKENIAAHYDLGNDFFELFLDPTMMYSSAAYPSPSATLDEAAVHKLDLICQSLELKPEDELIEIGTGWGGMAMYAAKQYGCKVTTTTISEEQYEYTLQAVKAEGLEDQITVLCQDYRKLEGSFDKLVSIEMIEAVGHEFYESYFRCVSKLLKPTGKAVIQAITIPDQRYDFARQSVDYIKRYIFPGGCLPSLRVISENLAKHTDLQITQLRDITLDYARTLEAWHHSFLGQTEKVKEMGFDDRFIRMWRFYLSYCEGGFRERIIGTFQITLAKPGYRPE
jgi:cyclopropane-fatty-acyl-phospholipid synthase